MRWGLETEEGASPLGCSRGGAGVGGGRVGPCSSSSSRGGRNRRHQRMCLRIDCTAACACACATAAAMFHCCTAAAAAASAAAAAAAAMAIWGIMGVSEASLPCCLPRVAHCWEPLAPRC